MLNLVRLLQESFSLWETGKWIKGVTKGDSILFIYRLKVCGRAVTLDSSNISNPFTLHNNLEGNIYAWLRDTCTVYVEILAGTIFHELPPKT